MESKNKNLKTGLISVISGLIIFFCLISFANASDEGLVAYYSFDEGSGNVLHDLSGNGNDGTIYGAKWVDGKFGNALSFDGYGDCVEIPDDNSLDLPEELTVEAWFNTNVIPSSEFKTIASKDENYEFHIDSDGKIYWWWRDSNEIQHTLTGNTIIQPGEWYHVAIVYSNSQGKARIYLNDNVDAKGSFTQSLMLNTDPFQIAQDQGVSERFFNGVIDEVRIYNRALSESEIKADMVSSFPKIMKKTIQDTISKTQTKIDQLKKENINTETLEKIITSADDALQKEAYKTALELAQDASSKADKIYNAFQSYNSIKKEVDAKVDQLKRESVDTSMIEKSLSDAESEFGNGNFDLAQQLVSDAESKADKAWNTYQYIENAKNAVKEAEGISCDASDAKSRIKDALDALNKGSYDIAKTYAQDGISLAYKANCGRIKIEDLKALAVKYNGRTVEVSGKVRDIKTVYGRGYTFTVDDGTGLIMVGYEGSMKDINSEDSVVVVGVFSESSNAIIAEKVEKAGLISGGGGGSGIWLIIIGIIVIIVILVLYFKVIKKSPSEKKREDKHKKSGEWEEV